MMQDDSRQSSSETEGILQEGEKRVDETDSKELGRVKENITITKVN